MVVPVNRWYGTVCNTLSFTLFGAVLPIYKKFEFLYQYIDCTNGCTGKPPVQYILKMCNLNLNYHVIYLHTACDNNYNQLEATAASKRPRRSNLTSDLKSVTSITCVDVGFWSLKASLS